VVLQLFKEIIVYAIVHPVTVVLSVKLITILVVTSHAKTVVLVKCLVNLTSANV